jgi:hypothetical protein
MTRQLTFESSFDDEVDDFSFSDDETEEDEFDMPKKKVSKRCPVCQEKGCLGDCADLD